MSARGFTIYAAGSNAITIQMGDRIDEACNKNVLALFHYLQEKKIPGVIDIVPAYCSVTLVYDILQVRKQNTPAFYFMQEELERAFTECDFGKRLPSRRHEIPVCYDPSLGFDIKELSAQKNISIEAIIAIHSSKAYRVYMIGFLPGFAYMGSVEEEIVVARKTTPRTLVPAGSVGIAGEQTGIYPLDSPGGWNIIGRTPLKIFDAKKNEPVLLAAGDEVRFIPISIKEFQLLQP